MSGSVPFQRTIVVVLRWGASLSTLMLSVGIILSLSISSNPEQHFYIIYQPQKLVEDLFINPSPAGLATTGLLFLVMTPVVRVVVAIFNFICSKDWKFAGISVGVLLVILMGVFLGG